MGKANVSRRALVQAIATLEAQRGAAADDRSLNQAVDTALLALRDKLAQLQSEPDDRKRHELAVLVADLSGFTALSERMDVERVRDAINAMWQVLDAVIRAWGGRIDQHAGDSLMALFGLPQPRRGDAVRALQAALAMQQELALFNERVRRAAADPFDESWVGEWPGPNMRVGVHSGSVYFARAPGGARFDDGRITAVGDTIAVARRLEEAAPAGSVLASDAVRSLAADRFTFAPLPDDALPPSVDDAYLVTDERAPVAAYAPGTVAGQITRLVGRAALLDRLDMALQTVADSRSPQMVTIVGEPGSGKSRLVHEFEQHVRLLGSTTVLRADTQVQCAGVPYALVRDFLLRRFAIRPQHSPHLIEWKLRRGVVELERRAAAQQLGPLDPPGALRLLEKLLDVGTAATVSMEEALAVIAPLLQAMTTDGPAIVVLDGLNRADSHSLALVERLTTEGEVGPVLFLGLATLAPTTDPAQVLPWLGREADLFSPLERLNIPPLSAVDGRLMATDILRPLAPPPMRLLDLVVAEANGNPLYIETFVQLLIERGVIAVGDRWRVDMARAEEMPLTGGLPQLFAARLADLPELERAVLQRAAVFGSLCWDTALLEMEPALDLDATQIDALLAALEARGYLTGDDVYSFGASRAYAFRRDTAREVAYAGVAPESRRALHLGAARWLIANRESARLGAWIAVESLIAHHFAAAGAAADAHAWRQREVAGSRTP